MNTKILLLALLFALAPAAVRAELRLTAEIIGGIQTGPSWPTDPMPYKFARVVIENPNPVKVSCTLNVNGYPAAARMTFDGLALEPGARRVLNLPLPGLQSFSYQFYLSAANGERATTGASVRGKCFLNIAPVAEWASAKELIDFSARTDEPPPGAPSAGPPGDAMGGFDTIIGPNGQMMRVPAGSAPMSIPGGGGMMGGFADPGPIPTTKTIVTTATGTRVVTTVTSYTYAVPTPTPRPVPKNDYVAQLEPENLPDNWLCYSPFIAVFIPDATYKTLPADAREALLRWVEAGGRLEVYGAAEERSERRLLGLVHTRPGSPLADKILPREWRVYTPPPWLSVYRRDGGDFPYAMKSYAALGNLGGLALATLFCIIAGPVNYFYFRRRGRLRMLLISLPAISIGFCLLIGGYFIASKGFTRQGGSFAITLLDEGRARAFTFTRHMLLSGLYPLGGFTFDREAAFFPLQPGNDRDPFSFDLGQGQRLTSGLFIPQVPFHYFTALPHATRERLVCDLAARNALNGFETPIEAAIAVRGDKAWLANAMAPGARATLEEHPAGEAVGLLGRFMTPREVGFLQGAEPFYDPAYKAPGGYYVVLFKGDLPTGQAGVKIKSGSRHHVLFSALPTPEAKADTP